MSSQTERVRIDKGTMQQLTLDDINVRLQHLLDISAEMLNVLKSQQMKGVVLPLTFEEGGILVDTTPKLLEFAPPRVKLTIFNDGPSNVFFTVNSQKFHEVGEVSSNGQVDVDFKRPLIEKIYLFTKSGTAKVRGFTNY